MKLFIVWVGRSLYHYLRAVRVDLQALPQKARLLDRAAEEFHRGHKTDLWLLFFLLNLRFLLLRGLIPLSRDIYRVLGDVNINFIIRSLGLSPLYLAASPPLAPLLVLGRYDDPRLAPLHKQDPVFILAIKFNPLPFEHEVRLIKRVGALALHHRLRLLPILVVFLEDLLDLHLQLPDLLTLLQVNIAALDRGRAIKEFVFLEELSEIKLELPLRLFRIQSVRFLRLILRGQGTG